MITDPELVPVSASVTGLSHQAQGHTCQDFVVATSIDDTIILVACDGAGSAKFSGIGARITAESVSRSFSEIAAELATEPPGEWLIDEIVNAILVARDNLRSVARDQGTLADYHTTLVSVVSNSSGGFICHIGDGYGIAITKVADQPRVTISRPENGEYANETYFVTEGHWIKHIRITPFSGKPIAIAAMTDGAASLFERGNRFVESRFLTFALKHGASSEKIREVFNDPMFANITSDDKSISIATDPALLQALDRKWFDENADTSTAFGLTASDDLGIPPRTSRNDSPSKTSQLTEKQKLDVRTRILVAGLSVVTVGLLSLIAATVYVFSGFKLDAENSSSVAPQPARNTSPVLRSPGASPGQGEVRPSAGPHAP